MIAGLLASTLVVLVAVSGPADAAAQVEVTDEHATVRNDRVVVTLSKAAKGSPVSLRAPGGPELAAPGPQPRLFELTLSQKGDTSDKRRILSNADAAQVTYEAGAGTLTLRCTDLAGTTAAVTCTLSVQDGDPMVRWRISLTLPPDLVLESIHYPILGLRAPLHDGQEESVVMGDTKGGVARRPSAWKEGTWYGRSQPGNLTAQFATLYDPTAGVYVGCEDGVGLPKGVAFWRTASGINLRWTHECYVEGHYDLPYPATLTTFTGQDGAPADWRDAADLYKQWAVNQYWCAKTFEQRADVPQWLKQGPAMVRFNRTWLTDPESIERWVQDYWGKYFGLSIPLITAYWGWEKVGSWVTPDYFPVYPSDEQFTALTAKLKAFHCHAFPWPSGYHYTLTYRKRPDGTFEWDDRERFAQVAEPHAVHNRDGSLYRRPCSWLQGGENACMCPGDPWTIDWFNHLCTELVRRGADMIQVDQVVGGNFPRCYSTTHGHPPGPGPWINQVFLHQLRSLLQECRKLDPQAVIGVEEPNEWFLQEVMIQDYRDWEVLRSAQPPREPASVFNYLYHEYVPTFQSNPDGDNKLMTAYCLVNGQIPHMVPRQLLSGNGVPNGDFERWSQNVPTGWDKVGSYRNEVWDGLCAPDPDQRHAGKFSLRLHNDRSDQTVQVSQNIPVDRGLKVGGTYRLRVWMKSDGLERDNNVLLGTFAPEMKALGGCHVPMPRSPGDWTCGEATFVIPPQTVLIRIMLHLSGKGTVWIDDMSLEEQQADGSFAPLAVPDKPVGHELMRQWVALFHGEGRPYLLLGKMLHPPKLQVATIQAQGLQWPAILHNAFEAPDGSRAMVAVNISDQVQEAHWETGGKSGTLRLQPWEVQLVRF
jgi:hypothetical protein